MLSLCRVFNAWGGGERGSWLDYVVMTSFPVVLVVGRAWLATRGGRGFVRIDIGTYAWAGEFFYTCVGKKIYPFCGFYGHSVCEWVLFFGSVKNARVV